MATSTIIQFPSYKFTPQARKFWDSFTRKEQQIYVNNAYCAECGMTSMKEVSGVVKQGALLLTGTCTRCGGAVRRLVFK